MIRNTREKRAGHLYQDGMLVRNCKYLLLLLATLSVMLPIVVVFLGSF